ncbi:mucin-5AC-like [Schistocerca piceifrons]|uniref:mucin-5AC-like n=1 Tax=Schistocerca piceifrons TaxID=274613 RepID=UPI001F5FBB47|nr:mucin-5AC-like [Schistocerca piceifrons]
MPEDWARTACLHDYRHRGRLGGDAALQDSALSRSWENRQGVSPTSPSLGSGETRPSGVCRCLQQRQRLQRLRATLHQARPEIAQRRTGDSNSAPRTRRITRLPAATVEPPAPTTVLPLTYASALSSPPTGRRPSDHVPVTLPAATDIAGADTSRSKPEATPAPLPTATTSDIHPPEHTDAPSFDVPATAFLSERRDSLPSSDTEGRTRKQRSPKRRKRRRRTVSERDGSPPPDAPEAVRPDEASENLHDDTNDNMTPTVDVSMPTLLARSGANEPMDSTDATAAETSSAPTTEVKRTTITMTTPSMVWSEDVDEDPDHTLGTELPQTEASLRR